MGRRNRRSKHLDRLRAARMGWGGRPPGPVEPDNIVRPRSAMRTQVLGILLTLGMMALIVRGSAIMLFPDPQLEDKAKNQFKRAQKIEGRRGDILSRDGEFLATSVKIKSLHVDPSRLDGPTARLVADQVSPVIGKPAKEILNEIEQNRGRQDVRLARDLLPEQIAPLRTWLDKLANDRFKVSKDPEDLELKVALFTRTSYRRFYPGQADAAALLGLVGRTGTALAGVERFFNRQLDGETYKFVQWRDRKGRRITPDEHLARPGNDVLLTIDRRLQRATEEALDEVVTNTAPVAAQAVVMDVQTGEILAISNRPSHNPNDLRGLSMPAFRNQAFFNSFEPGSVFKPFVVAAAIEEKMITPEKEYFLENNHYVVRGGRIKDDHPKRESLTVTEIIKYSSNIGSAKIAFEMGAEKTVDYLSAFGFGRDPGLNLPNVAKGALRAPEKTKPIELATTAYGHGVSASALQLVSAVASLGNDGVRMKPMLVREIRDANGTPLEVFHPEKDRQIVSADTAEQVIDMMLEVTQQTCWQDREVHGHCRGTGTRAAVPGYLVAGKTGTANKYMSTGYSDTERISSFIGLIPADDPKLAVVIVVDGPTQGPSKGAGIVAAPAFASIGRHAMRQLGVPANPDLLEVNEPTPIKAATEPEPPQVTPELRWDDGARLLTPNLDGMSMRDALVTLQGSGLHIRFEGSGRVVQQSPIPGRPLRPGQPVEVVLQ